MPTIKPATFRLNRLLVPFAALAFSLPAVGVDAGFKLLAASGSERGAAFTATLNFTPSPLLAGSTGSTSEPIINPATGERETLVLSPSAGAQPLVESARLATPWLQEFDATQWTVRVESPNAAVLPANIRESVSLRPVQLGSVKGIELLVDASATSATDRDAIDLLIHIDGPTIPPVAVEGTRSISDFPEAARLVQSAFLNGAAVTRVASQGQAYRRGVSIPQPAGPMRATYSAGDEIIRVPLSSLGILAADANRILARHHGTGIPVLTTTSTDAFIYAPRTVTSWDKSDTVFLSINSTPVAGAATRPAFNTLAPLSAEVPISRHKVFDRNLIYDRLMQKPVERFPYYRGGHPQSVASGVLRVNNITLSIWDRLTSTQVDFGATLYGYNQSSPSPDHYANFTIGGVAIPQVTWEGRVLHQATATLNLPAVPLAGPDIVINHTISNTSPAAPFGDYQNLDVLELTYMACPRAESGTRGTIDLAADPGGNPRLVTMGGFAAGTTSADLLVVDITDPLIPVVLTSTSTFTDLSATVAVEFEAPAAACRFFIERLDAAVLTNAVASEALPPFPSSGQEITYYMVRPPALAAALSPLVSHRGPGVVEIEPQAAYNAFSHGQESPEAIRQALSWYQANAPARVPVPYVLLAGHASLDPRNYLNSHGSAAQVPTFIELGVVSSSGQLEDPVDYTYALLEGSDQVPDAMVGRIPAKTPADLTIAVNRIIAHDAIVDDLIQDQRPALFVSDDEIDFTTDSPYFASIWDQTGNPSVIIDLPTTSDGTAETLMIESELESTPSGCAFVMYTGHGNFDRWAGESIVITTDLPTFDTQNKWPLVGTFTCLNGYYCFPNALGLSLAEQWCFTDPFGAIANIAPGGVDFYFTQKEFALQLLNAFGRPEPTRPRKVGEAMMIAQAGFVAWYPAWTETLHEYLLFGDPASDLTLDQPPSEVADWAIWQ